MAEKLRGLTGFERFLSLFTVIRPGEGHCIYLLVLKGFLLMFSYYMLKPVRETLLLLDASPEIGSYSAALSAGLLLAIIPIYSFFYRRTNRDRLTQRITVFFIANLLVFYLLGHAGMHLGVVFFVWLSIFNLMIVAQFWAFATDIFNAKTGRRLFALIAVGVSLGATLGSLASAKLAEVIDPYEIMLAAALVLCLPPILSNRAERAVPPESRGDRGKVDDSASENPLGGFAVVARDYYLALIALFIVLLNWIMTTGDFILRSWVTEYASTLIAESGAAVSKGEIIGHFYGNFFAIVSVLSLAIQLFLVSRIFQYFGIRVAVMIMPAILILSYGIIGFLPVFTIIQWVRTVEISTNYSLQNTTRHALFLPTSRSGKYEGKTTIDTFFWRFGDMVQAGAIFAGIHWFGFEATGFAFANMGLAVIMLGVAGMIGREYTKLMATNVSSTPPVLNRTLEDFSVQPGEKFRHELEFDTFVDADPGDILVFHATLASGGHLPHWLRFDSHRLIFRGRCPSDLNMPLEIEVRATDVDGLSTSGTFSLRPG